MILCLLIIIIGVVSGQLKAKSYENRLTHLQSLISTLKILQSEMKYKLDPLPIVFERIGKTDEGLSYKLLAKTCEILKSDSSFDFSSCWQEAVDYVYKDSSLTKKDLQIISDIGYDLGKTDMEGQSSLFTRAFTLLEIQVGEANQEKVTKGRMYKSLGAAVGFLIVIIFV